MLKVYKDIRHILFLTISVIFMCWFPCRCLEFSSEIIQDIKLSCEKDKIEKKETFSVNIGIKSKTELDLPNFKALVAYDPEKLSYKSIKPGNNMKRGQLKSEKLASTCIITYCPQKSKIKLPENEYVHLFDINFSAKCRCQVGETTISVTFETTKNTEFEPIDFPKIEDLKINIIEKVHPPCPLASLIPSEGKLSPDFDPSKYEYTIDVPYTSKNIDFDAVPQTSSTNIKINRRKLYAAGKNTNIKITVSDKETASKSIYEIKVNRNIKPSEKVSSISNFVCNGTNAAASRIKSEQKIKSKKDNKSKDENSVKNLKNNSKIKRKTKLKQGKSKKYNKKSKKYSSPEDHEEDVQIEDQSPELFTKTLQTNLNTKENHSNKNLLILIMSSTIAVVFIVLMYNKSKSLSKIFKLR